MELSLNSDINLGNDSFHVQTEDWGVASPYIVSRIYKNGAVLKVSIISTALINESGDVYAIATTERRIGEKSDDNK